MKPQRYTIWYSVLALSSSSCSRKWILTAPLVPLVRRPHRDVPEGMYADDPSTALANFDVCRAGIAFIRESVGITRPHLQGAREVWFMPVEWEAVEKGVWQEDVEDEGTATGMVTTTVPTAGSSKNEFASLSVCGHVRFSPSGKRLAFLAAPLSDLAKVSIFVVAVPRDTSVWDPFNPRRGEETVRRVYDGTAPFYRSPSSLQRPEAERASVLLPPLSFEWAPSREKDGEETTILVATEDGGRVRLDRLDFKSIEDVLASDNPHSVAEFEARRVTTDGTVAAYHPLPDEKWLVSSMSFVDSSLWTVVDASHDVLDRIEADDTTVPKPKVVSSATRHGKKFGLNHEEMVGEFWVDVGGAEVHTFVIRPMGWNHEKNRNKKWPWILMPHGGPESSWRDAWSTRVSPSAPEGGQSSY